MTLCREGWVLQRWEEVPILVKSGYRVSNKGSMKYVQENFRVSRLNTKASCRFLLVLS